MNMFTLIEMSQLMELHDGPYLPLKDLAIIGMYIEIERNKRRNDQRAQMAQGGMLA